MSDENSSPTIQIPSNPADREAIFQVIRDVSDQWAKIEGYKSYIKEAIEGVSEKYDLPKKYVNQMAKIYHAGVYNQKREETEDFFVLYEAIMRPE